MMMEDIAKVCIVGGLLLVAIGIGLYFFGKIPGIGRLPGDILIEKENFRVYFPLTTCLLISIVLSLVLYLWHQK